MIRLTIFAIVPLGLALTAFAGEAAESRSELATGRAYYTDGKFGKAASSFRMALKANPADAEASYWAGMSYQRLADIATPFGGRSLAKARAYLMRATQLAPERREYRLALFDFLLDSAYLSRTALRDASNMLRTVDESDPDYGEMRRQLEREKRANSAPDARLGRLFLAVPRTAVGVAGI
jgi:tetratricopeptide (TPR) repeat protein